MFKIFVSFLFAVVCVSECTVVKVSPYIPKHEFGFPNNPLLRSTDDIAPNLGSHVMDLLELIDVEKMAMVAMQYMGDPEVLMFMKFVLSPQFKVLIWEFETMEEFKEALVFLTSKGYDVELFINYINAALNLPPYENPDLVSRNDKGISGLLQAMIDTLPLEDMKKLFEIKLQTVPEIADLFETINSKEFLDIMRKMRRNPKFTEINTIFQNYGFDFEFLCKLAKEIFGDYYQGVFCE